MTKNDIIEELFRDKECRGYCLKITKGDSFVADDLLSYSLESLINKPLSFLQEKHQERKLKNYFAGIVYKSYNYPSSPFYIEHRLLINDGYQLNDNYPDELDIEDFVEADILDHEMKAYEVKGEKEWYEANVLRLYLKYGNLRALSHATGIAHTSLAHSINNIKKHLSVVICEKYY